MKRPGPGPVEIGPGQVLVDNGHPRFTFAHIMDETRNHDETLETPEGRPEELDRLKETVETQARRIDELSRAYAESINDRESFRARLEREKERQIESSRGDVARALFESMDELRLALDHGTADPASVVEGVRMIADGLQRRLEAMGLKRILAVGEAFDPLVHEAIDLVPTENRDEDGKVVEEVRAGWSAGERVVRAARVRVGRFVAPAGEA